MKDKMIVEYLKNIPAKIDPVELDDRFNQISYYFNQKLKPAIEAINVNATSGVMEKALAVLSNNYDGSTEYKYIGDINIDDLSLSLDKIAKIDAGSILGSDGVGIIKVITPTDGNQLLFYSLEEGLSFRRISSDDLDDDIFTGEQFENFIPDNFLPGTFDDFLQDNSIDTQNLQVIANAKIQDGEISFRHIGVFSDLPYTLPIAQSLTLDNFDDNSIGVTKIKDGTIDFAKHFIDAKPVNANNLVSGSLNDDHFVPYVQNHATFTDVNVLKDTGLIINLLGLTPFSGVKLGRTKLAKGSIGLANFTQEVQNAFAECLRIKQQIIQPPKQVKPVAPYLVSTGSYVYLCNAQVAGSYGYPDPLPVYIALRTYSNGVKKYLYAAFVDGGYYSTFSPDKSRPISSKLYNGGFKTAAGLASLKWQQYPPDN